MLTQEEKINIFNQIEEKFKKEILNGDLFKPQIESNGHDSFIILTKNNFMSVPIRIRLYISNDKNKIYFKWEGDTYEVRDSINFTNNKLTEINLTKIIDYLNRKFN